MSFKGIDKMRIVAVLVLVVCFGGCTHHQLRFNTVHQAQSVSDVHTHQILNNLARFVHDPHAIPHFSYPNQGVASVTDNANGNSEFNFNPYSSGFGFGGSRQNLESYTMTPINDPEKLTLMRCIYQRAISGNCTCTAPSENCPSCEKLFNQFNLGSTNPDKLGVQTYDGKSIYRLNKNGRFMAISSDNVPYTIPDKHDEYLVAQSRNEQNEVIYEIQSPENVAGWNVYKLQDLQVERTDNFEKILEENSEFVVLRVGDQIKKPKTNDFKNVDNSGQVEVLVETQKSENSNSGAPELGTLNEWYKISPYKQRLYAIPPDVSLNVDTLEAYFQGRTANEKKQQQIFVEVPVGLSSGEDLVRQYEDNSLENQAVREGKINASCISNSCWFKHGSRRQIPKDIGSGYVGRYKGTFVWVPQSGRDQLAKLTLAVLDIAFNDAPEGSTTEVYALVGSDGKTSANMSEATFVAKATLPRGANFNRLMPTTVATAAPSTDAAAKVASNRLDELRLKFKQDLVAKAKIDIFDLVKLDDSDASVEYVSTDYRKRSLTIRNDDYLIPIAADILSSKGVDLDLSQAIDVTKKDILDNARRFLDAEYQVQNTSGASAVDVDLSSSSPSKSQEPRSEGSILRLEQNLRALGL